MKKMIYLLVCSFFFYLGSVVSTSYIEDSRKNDSLNFEKVKNESRNGYVLYKLNDKILEENHLKGETEGLYDIFIEGSEGKKAKMFSDSREIIKNGQDYFVKLKDGSFLPNEKNVNEYIQIKLVEEMDMKLVFIKN